MVLNALRQAVNTVPGMIFLQKSVVQMMTNALIQDYRGCSNVKHDFEESCNSVMNAELARPYAMEPTNTVQEIVSAFEVRSQTNNLMWIE
jgi:hypothetical protein